MKTKDIMTSAPVTIRPGATVAEAAKAMLEAGVSGLPVVEADGTLAGMLTEGTRTRGAQAIARGPPGGCGCSPTPARWPPTMPARMAAMFARR